MIKNLLTTFLFLFTLIISNAQWVELGTGANALAPGDLIRTIASDKYGNIYAAGPITNSVQNVLKWDGTSWTQLGTGVNGLNANNSIAAIIVDDSGYVYASGWFTDSTSSSSGNAYVAKWDGTIWMQLGKDNNTPFNFIHAPVLSLALDKSGNLYASGTFMYPAKWDGSKWSGVGSLNPNSSVYCITTDIFGNLYAAGAFTNSLGSTYVAKWDGATWSELNNGMFYANSTIDCITTDKFGNVYAAGNFTDNAGKYYVAKWNGKIWSELKSDSSIFNYTIHQIAVDSSGNVYAVGYFTNGPTNSSGTYYVAKWDGTTWNNLGNLNANGSILSITIDAAENIYVGGWFQDSNQTRYIAKYSQSSGTTVISTPTSLTTLNAYPNPTNSSFTIITPEAGQITVYNTLGETVTIQAVQAGNTIISLDKSAAGVYTVIMTGQANSYTSIKIVKN